MRACSPGAQPRTPPPGPRAEHRRSAHELSAADAATVRHDSTFAVTKVWGQHTVKSGFYWLDATSWRGTGSPVGTLNFAQNASNPLPGWRLARQHALVTSGKSGAGRGIAQESELALEVSEAGQLWQK